MGLVVFAATCLFTSAIAQSPVGKWTGKLNLKMPQLPATADANTRQMVEQGLAAVKKMTLHLTFNKDKTYTMFTKDAPAQAGGEQKDNGTWSQSGKTISIISTRKGKKAEQPQTMVFSADAKVLTMTLPGGPNGGSSGNIVFKKD
jgi:hypothetical protein